MKRRTLVLWKRILVRVGIVICIFGCLFLYFKSNLFTIYTYDISGVDDYRKEFLIKKFNELESEKIFYIFPGNSVFTYHRNAIKTIIYDTLPNTASLSIYPPSLQTLKIVITAHTPMFRKGAHQAITQDGLTYTEINNVSSLPELNVASSTLMTKEILAKIAIIYPKISASLFPIQRISLDENQDIRAEGGPNKSEIIFNAEASMDTVWSNIVSAIDTEPLKSKLENHKDSLQYLDVRFGNKVFFRFTNGKEAAIIQDGSKNTLLHATTTNATPTSR